MPLRVALQGGYEKAVNGCGECPFYEILRGNWRCNSKRTDITNKDYIPPLLDRIPVWCPLPAPTCSFLGVDKGIESGDVAVKTDLRGLLKPEEMPRPIVFIVEDPGPPGFIAKEITIMPEFPQSPDWPYLRKDDCLVFGEESYWLCKTPVSMRIKITPGPDLEKGDHLVVFYGHRERITNA